MSEPVDLWMPQEDRGDGVWRDMLDDVIDHATASEIVTELGKEKSIRPRTRLIPIEDWKRGRASELLESMGLLSLKKQVDDEQLDDLLDDILSAPNKLIMLQLEASLE